MTSARIPDRTSTDYTDYADGSKRSGEITAKHAKTAKGPDSGFLHDPRPPNSGPRP